MKIHILFLALLAGSIPAFAQRTGSGAARTSVTVYTTADSTNYRLSPTGTFQFKPFGQPFENQACIFVDPSHKFQTFVGIGGAITDASAETFAKLPPARQQEFLTAYYNPEKGRARASGTSAKSSRIGPNSPV